MALMFEYRPGMDLVQPWPFTVVRSQPGYQVTKAGGVAQVAANVLRDAHYVSGVRTTLFEPGAINRCLQSQALATAPWVGTNVTLTNNNATAPDGTATGTTVVPTATNGQHVDQQSITVTAGEYVAWAGYIKATGYTGARIAVSGASGSFTAWIDLTAGTITALANGGTYTISGQIIVPLGNGHYWVGIWGKTATDTTTNGVLSVYQNGAGATSGANYAGDTVSGLIGWGFQLERNGTTTPQAPTSYMPTTVAVSSNRGADAASIVWPFKIMPMWCYSAWYDLGMCARAQSSFSITLTPAVAADPQWVALFGGVGSDLRTSWVSGAGAGGAGASNRNTALVAVTPVFGDFVETYSRVLANGSTLIAARRNGGSITVGAAVGPTGGVPFVDFAANPLLWLGFPNETIASLIGLTAIKIGADPTKITTLGQAALV